jgi:hypothetical protein
MPLALAPRHQQRELQSRGGFISFDPGSRTSA